MSTPASLVGEQRPPVTPALQARDVTVVADGRALISGVTLDLRPGEMVALIGPSGAGKTTLLRALSGSGPIHGGTIALAPTSGAEYAGTVGYVPSEDLIHDQLTVAEELLFAAALRAPAGTSDAELSRRVEAVVEDLNLTELIDQRVSLLSKGERRRTSCAVELVGQPEVLMLDEPGSGLDPGLERRLMRVLRRVADQGRAVLAATHATASLGLCDRVAVLARGGRLVCVGTVDEVLRYFQVGSVDEVYERLDEIEPPTQAVPNTGRGHKPLPGFSRVGFGRQLEVAAQRGIICRLRDVRSLAVLIGQAPIIGVAIGIVLPHDALQNTSFGPYYGVLLSFLLLVACTWLGTIAACRDIVSEFEIVRREVAIGLRYDAYLLARCLTLLPVVIIQCGAMAAAVLVLQPVQQGAGLVVLSCMATGVASACIGLWLSAWARTIDLAIASTPLIMIPQLLLAGALIPVGQLPGPLRVAADVFVGRWSFSALGSAIGLGNSLGDSLVGVTGLSATSFPAHPLAPIAVMLGIGMIAVFLAGGQLARRINQVV